MTGSRTFPRWPSQIWIVCLALTLSLGPASSAALAAPRSSDAPDGKEILTRAFANQYEVDIRSNIELRMENSSGQARTRRFEALQKIIGGRLHAIGRLTHPDYLRGMTILQIENSDSGHDAFVYMPSLDKVRRISMLQRGDSLFGTDVTYEDLERRRVADYTIGQVETGELVGEAVFVINTVPKRTHSAERVIFYVAQLDSVILEVQHYKNDSPEPFRVTSLKREGMVEADGHLLATRLTVRNVTRGTTTEVTFSNLEINPFIDDRVFSIRTMEQERGLFRSFKERSRSH